MPYTTEQSSPSGERDSEFMQHIKKTGALYIRVSTERQEELSPDAQIRECLAWAEKNNIHIPDDYIFRDDGISGRKAEKRPGFQALIGLAKSKEHPIDCIIVWKFSRFARNQEESIVYKSLLQKNNVDVLSVSEPLVDGPFGSLIERIIEWMDEYYSIRLSGEVMRGMTENAMRGKYQADPPIGYMHAGPGLPPIKDPETISIVESCVKWFLDEDMTPRQIAVRLNSLGYRTKRGNLFEARTVRYILENPFYSGKVRWNYTGRGRTMKPSEDVIYSDGKWEPLYSMDIYYLIQDRLKEIDAINAVRGRRSHDVSTYKHWLAGVVVCSSCGRTLSLTGSDRKGMQCWAYAKGMCKESHYITIEQLETNVISGLEQLLNSGCMKYVIVHKSATSSDKESELLRMLSRLDERERRAKEAYLNEIDTLLEYKENRMQINAERGRIQFELDALASVSSEDDDALMFQNVSDVLRVLKDETADYTQKGMSLRGIVDKIIFDRKNTSFEYYLKLVK